MSRAHGARWALPFARTDTSVSKHVGLTYFVRDMPPAEGVDARPLRYGIPVAATRHRAPRQKGFCWMAHRFAANTQFTAI
ncbi:hypothetical protein [Rhodococcus sp. T7]|uniref:hypothetical protein n=1 Tax=Rhodococcus sp. T7 TaxID=627444 RepID=UPI001358A79A|nr:hypothetical protein [Rhodococcus sp. T7]